MPQLSPMEWLFLYSFITVILFTILSKLNFSFKKDPIEMLYLNQFIINKKFKW